MSEKTTCANAVGLKELKESVVLPGEGVVVSHVLRLLHRGGADFDVRRCDGGSGYSPWCRALLLAHTAVE